MVQYCLNWGINIVCLFTFICTHQGKTMIDKIIPASGIARAVEQELNIPDPPKEAVAKLLEEEDDTGTDKNNKQGD